MTTIGILGAGQLGRMIALAGYPLGYRFRFFDPASESPANLLADHLTADYTDTSVLDRFVAGVDVVTYEFENVPVEVARYLEKSVPVYPPPIALEKAQNRFVEKSFFCEVGIPIPKFTTDLSKVNEIGFPAVLKTQRLGYDGKGQTIINSKADLENELSDGLILEEFISFDREVSIIAVRNKSGETRFYPLVENHHHEGILRLSLVIGNIPAELQKQAEEYATVVMNALNYVGVLAIEFFEKDGRLLANEMAPRVHNSGHWSIDGAITSQFENQVRAVTDAPLGDTSPIGACAMVNLIGKVPDVESILIMKGVHLHLYDKTPKPNRKIGHINIVAQSEGELMEKVEIVQRLLN